MVEIYSYRFVNQVPLWAAADDIVNWCELTILNASDGSVIYHNAFITNYCINLDNVTGAIDSIRVR